MFKMILKAVSTIGYMLMYLYASLVFMISAIIISIPIRLLTKSNIIHSIDRINKIYHLWIKIYFFLVGVKIKIYGAENEQCTQQYVIIANHRSFFDILALTPNLKRGVITIGKSSFGKVPFFAWIYKSGAILVNRKNTHSRFKSFQELKTVLSNGVSVCIYPEGTRNRGKYLLYPFQNGAFHLSLATKTPILPIILINTDRIMPVNNFIFRPSTIHLHILPPIFIQENDTLETLKNRSFKLMHNFLTDKLSDLVHA